MNKKLKLISKHLTDIIFPPQCISCNAIISEQGGLCSECFSHLTFISSPVCERCGRPLRDGREQWKICSYCNNHRLKASKYRFSLSYDEHSRKLILPLKHGDKTIGIPLLSMFMLKCGKDLLEEADGLIPVPLHRFRLIQRKYNQSNLLAKEISRISGIKFLADSLIRKKFTRSQGEFNGHDRKENVKGVFKVSHPEEVIGKRLVLIDDVITTGSTVDSCVDELIKTGAKEVSVLTLAAVL